MQSEFASSILGAPHRTAPHRTLPHRTLPRAAFFGLVAIGGTLSGCENYGEDADTIVVVEGTGDDYATTGEIPECAPFEDDDGGSTFECEGFGIGGASVAYNGGSTPFSCVTDLTQTTIQDCVANPIDFADIYSESNDRLVQPAVCCMGDVEDPEVIDKAELACIADCAHAACKWAAIKLRDSADTLSTDCGLHPAQCVLKSDLNQMADELETTRLEECVENIKMFSPFPAEWDTGSLGKDLPGGLTNVHLVLGCDVSAVVVDEPPVECTDSAHTIPIPSPHVVPSIYAAAYGGVFGEGSVGVLDDDYTVNIPTGCSTPPCPFELQDFVVEMDDAEFMGFEFEDITLSLAETANGYITGTSVSFAPEEMQFTLSFVVSFDGDYLLGASPWELPITHYSDTVYATYSSSVFTVQSAVFDYGPVLVVLNTDLPVSP